MSPFLSRLACQILSLSDNHGITLIPAYIPTPLNVEADNLSWGQMLSEWYLLPSDGSSSFLPQGSTRGGSAGILPYHSMPALFHLRNASTSGGLEVECLQLSLEASGKLCVSSSCFGSSSSVHISGRTVKGQLRLLILVAPCWMEGPWLPTILNMLADIAQLCAIVKDLIMDVLVGSVLKGLPYLHLTLWLLRDTCCTDRGSLPPSVR